MNSAFSSQILAEKLSKLNSSQQSIETLSHWCIFHRRKAREVAETWGKQFRELPKEQRVPFLYLANDILQNSRRKGSEFVNEFWRILPGALKDIVEHGDESGRSVVLRLVDIWEERKVFGSRARSLGEELLGKDPPSDLAEKSAKSSQMVKVKIPVGGIQEKLASAYQYSYDIATDEDSAFSRCNSAVVCIESLEKEVDSLQNSGVFQDANLADELQEQQNILNQCAEQLEMSEMAHATIVLHLKEALHEQESKLELIRTQLQIAQAQSERVTNLQQHLLTSSPRTGEIIQRCPRENGSDMLHNTVINHLENHPSGNIMRPLSPVDNMVPRCDETRKPKSAAEVAAEVAAKLAASTSSAQMLTSVLTSLAAEETSSLRPSLPVEVPSHAFLREKRMKLEEQPDRMYNAEGCASYIHQAPLPPQSDSRQHQGSLLQHHTSPLQQTSSVQHQLPPPPPLPPQPHLMPTAVSMISVPTFGFGGGIRQPPLPPLQTHPAAHLPHIFIPHQNAAAGPYQPLRPPGMGFYCQPPLPAPPVPRQ